MKFTRSKNTKRFGFRVTRNTKSHQSGANTLTIIGKDYDYSGAGYSTVNSGAGSEVVMTVKEAKALQGFLNKWLQDTSPQS